MMSIFIRFDLFSFCFFQRSNSHIFSESSSIIIWLLLFNIKLAQSYVISHHSVIGNYILQSLRFFFFGVIMLTFFTDIEDFTFIQLRQQILSVNLWSHYRYFLYFLLIPHIFLDFLHSKRFKVTSLHLIESLPTLLYIFLTIIPLLLVQPLTFKCTFTTIFFLYLQYLILLLYQRLSLRKQLH